MGFNIKHVSDCQYSAPITPYNLVFPCYKISDKGQRLLVVLDQVPRFDIEVGQLLSGNNKTVFDNILEYLIKHRKLEISQCLVVAYPFCSTRGLSPDKAQVTRNISQDRMDKFISRFNPDKIMLMGPDLIRLILPSRLDQVDATRLAGVVTKYKGLEITGTLSLSTIANDFDDSPRALDVYPNLIGFAINHFNYLLLDKKDRFTFNVDKYKCRIISSVKEFKKFYRKLIKAEKIAIDIETANLTKFSNTIYTIQFCWDGKTAWVLPWAHPETKFSQQDLDYFRKKLKRYFEHGSSKYHIYAYGQFDISQLKVQLSLEYYNHRVWDVQASAFSLDENRKFLWELPLKNDELKSWPAYSLAQLVLERGCPVYYDGTLKISKSQRDSLGQVPLQDVALYGGYDVVVSWLLCKSHQDEAKYRGSQYNKFENIVADQIGSMILEFVEMEINGLTCDLNYLLAQFHVNSKIETYLRNIKIKLGRRKSVLKAERIIKQNRNIPTGGLLGTSEKYFNIDKQLDQQTLFFDVLGLAPINERADRKGFKIDKDFQNQYKNIKEVAYFTQYNKAKTLRNTFIKGFYRILQNDPDSRRSQALHPRFKYFSIITGRSAAEKPSLQQVPAHGELSEIIKRIFIPEQGDILIKADYSAHEIRNWALVSQDDILSSAFQVGLDSRKVYRLIKQLDEKAENDWKQRFVASDLHRVNYGHFYKVDPSSVTAKQRQSIKGVVFGVLYGKQAKSLSQDLGVEINQAQDLIDLMFSKFKKGGDWINKEMKLGYKNARVLAPHGRVRHLWGYLHHSRGVHGKMDRRGPNSIIQGLASDQGYIGGRQLQSLVWNLFVKNGQPFSMKTRNKVHDSSENTCNLIETPISIYLLEHAMITQVRNFYRKVFDFDFGFDLGMDFAIGGSLCNLFDWDHRYDTLIDLTDKSIDWMKENLGHDLDKSMILEQIRHNVKIVSKLRRSELKGNSGEMQLTSENSQSLGFKFAKSK